MSVLCVMVFCCLFDFSEIVHLCTLCVFFFFFFFKQKTAYEMRISDWSSDVCSSDLQFHPAFRRSGSRSRLPDGRRRDQGRPSDRSLWRADRRSQRGAVSGIRCDQVEIEEHTSELQSLMRISYAVFCLKKTMSTIHHFRSTVMQVINDRKRKTDSLDI